MDRIFTDYLTETCHKIEKPFSTFKWLVYLDSDTLNMLIKSVDNFRDTIPESEIDEDASVDVWNLVGKLMELESACDSLILNENDKVECIQAFCGMVNIVGLYKKGLIDVTGDGRITTNDTTMAINENGKKIQEIIN